MDFSLLISPMLFRHAWSLLGLAAILLTGCSPSSKAIESLQTKILEDVVKQGGSSLKSVVCPQDKPNEPSFTCTGILESGSGFDIPVKSNEDKSYAWEIVSIKGLLNMTQLQTAMRSGLMAEFGEPTIDCGTTTAYKAAKPGEQFECQVAGTKLPATAKQGDASKPETPSPQATPDQSAKPAAANSKPEKTTGKVVVTIASSGDISWQRVLPEGPDKSAAKGGDTANKTAGADTKPDATAKADGAIAPPKSATDDSPTDAKIPAAEITAAPPSANKSAEEAVNAGAFNAAED
jgi:hypothetical protein